ncbi:MAG: hypothetical protein ACR2IE_03245 [Candidatus Sumerlaeaceae bacterium]
MPLIVVVLGAETALRLKGFGSLPPFFVPYLESASGSKLLNYSSDALWPYFGQRLAKGGQSRMVGSIVPQRVLMPKPAKLLRVFMVGESSVQGFPFPPNLSAASFLDKYLEHSLEPGYRVEVINTGITAIASFPLRRVVREICALEPDLIIIYAGHNEYYGAFGVASAQSVGSSAWQMQLAQWWRSTGIGQGLLAVAETVATARARKAQPDAQTSETLMELMGTAEISPGSPLRDNAETALASNIDAMLTAAYKAKVQVVMCSLAANERDLLPVRSIEPGSEPYRTQFRTAYQRAFDAMSSGPAIARPFFEQAANLCPESAITQLYLGRMCDLQNDTTAALAAYRRARDLDAMPWRAATTLNEMLRRIAETQNMPFCDVDAAFHADAREHGEAAPGWRLFADHLHPSLEGQALFARALFETIRGNKLLPLTERPAADWRDLARQLGENRLVNYRVAHLMASLFQRPPLDKDSAAFRHALRLRTETLTDAADFETRAADRYVTESMSNRQPWSISFIGGQEALAARNHLSASLYFDSAMQEAVRFSPERSLAGYYSSLAQALGRGQLTTSTIERARRELSEAAYIEKAETEPAARENLLHALTGLSLLADDPLSAKKWAKAIPDASVRAPRVIAEVKQIEKLRTARRTLPTTSTLEQNPGGQSLNFSLP